MKCTAIKSVGGRSVRFDERQAETLHERSISRVRTNGIEPRFDAEIDETAGPIDTGLLQRRESSIDIPQPHIDQARLVR